MIIWLLFCCSSFSHLSIHLASWIVLFCHTWQSYRRLLPLYLLKTCLPSGQQIRSSCTSKMAFASSHHSIAHRFHLIASFICFLTRPLRNSMWSIVQWNRADPFLLSVEFLTRICIRVCVHMDIRWLFFILTLYARTNVFFSASSLIMDSYSLVPW